MTLITGQTNNTSGLPALWRRPIRGGSPLLAVRFGRNAGFFLIWTLFERLDGAAVAPGMFPSTNRKTVRHSGRWDYS